MSGIFGVSHQDTRTCILDVVYGTDYHSHLGSQRAGMTFVTGGQLWRKIHDISAGAQFKDRFEKDITTLTNTLKFGNPVKDAKLGIGVISDHDAQPVIVDSAFGTFAIVTMGLINNLEELVERLRQTAPLIGTNGTKINSTEVVARLICQGQDFVTGINNLWSQIDGSISLMILAEDGRLIAARDRYGVSPLCFGEKPGGYAITTESCALYNLGYQPTRCFKPGEILEITEAGPRVLQEGDKCNCRICCFFWIYTGYPAAEYEGKQVETVRYRCGAALAKRDSVEIDIVAGVPDSGTGHAIGYANEAKVRYGRVLTKYTPTYSRSYTPPDQETRDRIARMKLFPVKELIATHRRILLCEDSIVRGTQLGNFTLTKLFDCGATEVHVRPACPPLMFPCRYLRSTRDIHELATRVAIRSLEGSDLIDVSAYLDPTSCQYQAMVEKIRERLGATTLRYQWLQDMIAAIGLPAQNLCTYCWTGETIDGR
ncbi:MAG: amidophosphoribosyltransferase [Patescibacteria group bacterium]|jgi:amidophosphoribosyltransferase